MKEMNAEQDFTGEASTSHHQKRQRRLPSTVEEEEKVGDVTEARSRTMFDLDLLDCPVCFHALTNPIFQAEAAPTAIEATNPLNEGQRELSDEFNTKLNLDNQNEASDEKMLMEADYSSSSDDSSESEEEPMIVNPPRSTTTGGSRTLFAGNLALQVKKSDIEEFFQEAGQVVDVKFSTGPDGSCRGFSHILFSSPEEAQNALGFQGRTLLGRPIRLDMALERS
ncbi:nucleolin 1-like isoform X2 [Raphanus sativus]|uniref:Nucleolin 1-like isoform X2 n=1 Tax=Raphanus sativus TaxID=3726 RepID=A0A9W3C464_RAPSA|nr:nucleolin 1-like isoform X2 [Raphanus sativus]